MSALRTYRPGLAAYKRGVWTAAASRKNELPMSEAILKQSRSNPLPAHSFPNYRCYLSMLRGTMQKRQPNAAVTMTSTFRHARTPTTGTMTLLAGAATLAAAVSLLLSKRKWLALDATNEEKDTTDHHPHFPTLRAKLLPHTTNHTTHSPPPINQIRIPIQNDLFVGHASLMLRPLQPHHDVEYSDKLRRHLTTDHLPAFYFLLEGQFQRPLRKSQVFMGAKLVQPHAMQETVLKHAWMRHISNWLLQLLSFNVGGGGGGGDTMLYSFGSSECENGEGDTSCGELPHISFPLHLGMDTVESVEAKVSRKRVEAKQQKRTLWNPSLVAKSSATPLEHINDNDSDTYWRTDQIYSMSFRASCIDLVTWTVLRPLEMHLSRFWGSSPVQLVVYHHNDKSSCNDDSDQYIFGVQLEHLDTRDQFD